MLVRLDESSVFNSVKRSYKFVFQQWNGMKL